MDPWDRPVSAKEATAAKLRGFRRFYPDFHIELDPPHGLSEAQLADLVVQIRRRLGMAEHLEVWLDGGAIAHIMVPYFIQLYCHGDPIWSTRRQLIGDLEQRWRDLLPGVLIDLIREMGTSVEVRVSSSTDPEDLLVDWLQIA
jgi:hypothetical protein